MRLTSIQKGDIVRVAGSLAFVIDKQSGKLLIRWNGRSQVRWAKAAEVEAHWRQSKASV